MISIEEYHRLKSYYPRRTTHEQLTRVPHICESKEWRTSSHCRKQCWHCVEVTKIIEFEDLMEENIKIANILSLHVIVTGVKTVLESHMKHV